MNQQKNSRAMNCSRKSLLTPERPQKKSRLSETPPSSESSSPRETSLYRWQWQTGAGEWNEYSPSKNESLENAFSIRDTVTLTGYTEHVVDFKRLVQVNVETGRERPIRRIPIEAVEKAYDETRISRAHQIRRFDGTAVYLNKIPDCATPGLAITFADIVGSPTDVEAVFLTSFGADFEWLLAHFQGGTPITLIDQPQADVAARSIVPLGNYWPMFQVIYPKFDKGGIFETGTMHSKLTIVKWKNNRGLRIVISSANLFRFDWEGITQVNWAIDIDLSTEASHAVNSFGSDLCDFVESLVKDETMVTDWISILRENQDRISSQVPSNIFLLSSVPGTHAGATFSKYGQLRLRSILAENNTPFNQSVQFQMSSIGMLQQPFMQSFIESVHSSPERFKIVWPEYKTAMHLEGNDHMMLYQKNEAGAVKYMTPLRQLDSRKSILNHSKAMIADSFMYLGSHNLSMSAWGRTVFENKALQIASFELGILILNPHSLTIQLPFTLNPQTPPMNDRPWMVDEFRRRVSAGSENLTDTDKQCIRTNNGGEQKPLSLADFLALKSRKTGPPIFIILRDDSEAPIVEEFLETTWFARRDIDIFAISKKCDYGEHISAFFRVGSFPAIIAVAGGCALDNHCTVLGVLESAETVLCTSADEFIGSLNTCESTPSTPGTPENVSSALTFVEEKDITLLCLDVDGTIVDSNKSSVLIPRVAEFVSKLNVEKIKIALVTNQGAVGLRHWMTANSFGDPSSLPIQEEVENRLQIITDKIKELFPGEVKLFMAFRYQSKGEKGRWGPVPFKSKDDPRWKQEWRKPNSGMIVEAMKWANIGLFNKNKVLMVGDMDADEGAAKAAGVMFKKAPDFFD